ncbi:MAG: NAD-binding protein [Betaproteobacteria bacterium]|nr:NAD-binding protein [Betaproteobacteria bacterium]
MTMERRNFLARLGAYCAAAGLPAFALADDDHDDDRRGSTRPGGNPSTLPVTGLTGRVVVVGGGMAGAAVAKFLRLWGGAGVQVTLVEREPRTRRTSSPTWFSQHGADVEPCLRLRKTRRHLRNHGGAGRGLGRPGVEDTLRRHGFGAAHPRLRPPRGGTRHRLRLSGWTANRSRTGPRDPCLDGGGPQTTTLRDQIRAMPAGGSFVMTVPPAPYRCPPGPYERACVVADWLKRNRPGSRVVVLDANPAITAGGRASRVHSSRPHAGIIITYGAQRARRAGGRPGEDRSYGHGTVQGRRAERDTDERGSKFLKDIGWPMPIADSRRWTC